MVGEKDPVRMKADGENSVPVVVSKYLSQRIALSGSRCATVMEDFVHDFS